MKTTLLFLIFLWISTFGGHNLTLAEASGILGEQAVQLEKNSTAEGGGHQFRTRFQASGNEQVFLYYQFENFENETAAKAKFDEFHAGNVSQSGFKDLSGLGHEAFFHTDDRNFSLIIARKGNEMIRLKVNKITNRYSKEKMEQVARDILARI